MRRVKHLNGGYDANADAVIVGWGGPDAAADLGLVRAYVRGPTSTVALYIGNEVPTALVGLPQLTADDSLLGAGDYASWNPPLLLPAGWWAAFAWTGDAATDGATATVRLEYEDELTR